MLHASLRQIAPGASAVVWQPSHMRSPGGSGAAPPSAGCEGRALADIACFKTIFRRNEDAAEKKKYTHREPPKDLLSLRSGATVDNEQPCKIAEMLLLTHTHSHAKLVLPSFTCTKYWTKTLPDADNVAAENLDPSGPRQKWQCQFFLQALLGRVRDPSALLRTLSGRSKPTHEGTGLQRVRFA